MQALLIWGRFCMFSRRMTHLWPALTSFPSDLGSGPPRSNNRAASLPRPNIISHLVHIFHKNRVRNRVSNPGECVRTSGLGFLDRARFLAFLFPISSPFKLLFTKPIMKRPGHCHWDWEVKQRFFHWSVVCRHLRHYIRVYRWKV